MITKLYIQSASCISPQHTFGDVPLLPETVVYNKPLLNALEPDYKPFFDPKQSRRMSRIIRMGVAAAKDCLQRAALAMPGAIITGTAYGCVEDTSNFLTRLIEMNEEMLSPTAFIQSTHNTVAAQIALLLQCHAYNNTFVHKSFSFESALQDARMLIQEGEADNVLVGGIDEITDVNYAIFNRFNIFKKGDFTNTDLYRINSPGTIAGEGTAFFVISDKPGGNNLACLQDFRACYKPKDIRQSIQDFLVQNNLTIADIDLVISGRNGDQLTDEPLIELERTLFNDNPVAYYKHLCGEYPVATSFALWLAASVVKNEAVPPALGVEVKAAPQCILICNNYQNKYWSLMLVSAC